MAAIQNERDILLQATSPRIIPIPIDPTRIPPGSITTPLIADGAVTAPAAAQLSDALPVPANGLVQAIRIYVDAADGATTRQVTASLGVAMRVLVANNNENTARRVMATMYSGTAAIAIGSASFSISGRTTTPVMYGVITISASTNLTGWISILVGYVGMTAAQIENTDSQIEHRSMNVMGVKR